MGVEYLLGKLTPNGSMINNLSLESNNYQEQAKALTAYGKDGVEFKMAEIASCDVAAALKGLDNLEYYYTLATFTDDKTATQTLWKLLTERVKKQWPNVNTTQAQVLSLLAMERCVWCVRCQKCSGRKVIHNRLGLERECLRCHGTGKQKISGVKSASMLGVSESAWRKTWKQRLLALQSELDQCESRAFAHLSRQLDRTIWVGAKKCVIVSNTGRRSVF